MGELTAVDFCLIVAAIAAFWVALEIFDLGAETAISHAMMRLYWFDKYRALSREVDAYEEDEQRDTWESWRHIAKRIHVEPSSVWLRIEGESEWEIADQLTRQCR